MNTDKAFAFAGMTAHHATLLLVVLIFAASLTVRLYRLDGQTLECDELYTVPAATGHQYVYLSSEPTNVQQLLPMTTSEYRELVTPDPSIGLESVRGVLKRNVHLPFYFYLMHYWTHWFGTSEWVLRFPSALFGALSVVMLFLLGRQLFNPFVGLVSAILLAFSPEQIYFSQQARMYSLLVLLVVASTYIIVLTASRPTNKWLYGAYALISIAGLYTHYEYVFCLAAQTAYLWLASPNRRQTRFSWLLTQLIIAAAFLPWVLIGIAQKKTSPEIIAWVNGSLAANLVLTEFVTKTARMISVPELPFGWISVVVSFVLLVLGGISLGADRSKLFLLISWMAFPIAGVLLMDNLLGTRAISITRYWIVITPALYLLISLGVQKIKSRPVQIGLVAAFGGFLLAAALLTAQGKLRGKPDRHKEMAQFIDSQISQPSDQLLLTEGLNSLPLALGYYGQRETKILRHKWLVDQLKLRTFNELTQGTPEIFLMVSGQSRGGKLLEENGFHLEGKPVQFGHVVIAKYILNRTSRTTPWSSNDARAP